MFAVLESRAPGTIGADEIALHDVVARIEHPNPVIPVAGDHVASGGFGASDQIIAGIANKNAGDDIGERSVAGRRHSDVISLNDIASRCRTADLDAVNAVAGDDISCRPDCAS